MKRRALVRAVELAPGNGGGPVARPPLTKVGDDNARRAAAEELGRMGYDVDWRLCRIDELRDWVARAQLARVLSQEYGLQTDWRTHRASELRDWQLRLDKAERLRRHGVHLDWRLFTRDQLAEIERVVVRAGHPPASAPSRSPWARLDDDPDAVIEPAFVTERAWPREFEDALLEPASFDPRRPLRPRIRSTPNNTPILE